MTEKFILEIRAFSKALREKRYSEAQNVIDNAKFMSNLSLIGWQWELNWEIERSIEKLDELYDLLVIHDYKINLINLYFVKCLYHRDKARFNRVFSPENLKNCDECSPIFYAVIGNFLNDLPSSEEEKKMAKSFHCHRDEEFLKYLAT